MDSSWPHRKMPVTGTKRFIPSYPVWREKWRLFREEAYHKTLLGYSPASLFRLEPPHESPHPDMERLGDLDERFLASLG
jgi:hypothetical protein